MCGSNKVFFKNSCCRIQSFGFIFMQSQLLWIWFSKWNIHFLSKSPKNIILSFFMEHPVPAGFFLFLFPFFLSEMIILPAAGDPGKFSIRKWVTMHARHNYFHFKLLRKQKILSLHSTNPI